MLIHYSTPLLVWNSESFFFLPKKECITLLFTLNKSHSPVLCMHVKTNIELLFLFPFLIIFFWANGILSSMMTSLPCVVKSELHAWKPRSILFIQGACKATSFTFYHLSLLYLFISFSISIISLLFPIPLSPLST